MTRIFLLLLLLSVSPLHGATPLYIRSFGDSTRPAIIFLHGGPGYNSALFEGTTAARLADSGFFVVVYDRRGEGRSPDSTARFNFDESTADILGLYRRFRLTKATLIGHSFGGVVGIRFAASNPELIHALVLAAAPVSMQASFRNILDRCQQIYEAKKDTMNLSYLTALRSMDTASMMYSTYCLGHAMQNGFYAPRQRSDAAREIYRAFRADTALAPYASRMDFSAPRGFQEHERYTTLDLAPELRKLRAKGVHIFGFYGQEDGLYSLQQVEGLRRLIGADRVRYAEACSHNVFLDQQDAFIAALRQWIRP